MELSCAARRQPKKIILSAPFEDFRFIAVFLFGVFVVVLMLGSCLYAAEGGQKLMNSIPAGMWWLGCSL